MKKGVFLILSFFPALLGWASRVPSDTTHHFANTSSPNSHEHPSCERLLDFFHSGEVTGAVRYFFMNTNHTFQNERYYANAIGGRLGFHTAEFHGFSAGLEGIFVYNIGSSHFHDSTITNYEAELFDLTHLHNRNDLDRLEELYVNYRWGKSFIKFGKQDISTPLVNKQDTRMKPYVLRGIWSNIHVGEQIIINAGYFDKTSPRSTTHWYAIDEAIGLYRSGFEQKGEPSDYHQHLQSKGLFIGGVEYHPHHLSTKGWVFLIENILATYMLQIDYEIPIQRGALVFGAQGLYQEAHHQGGNTDATHTYYTANQIGKVASGRIGFKRDNWLTTLNFTQIGSQGRFVFPREFGREQFYSTMPRGRIEGAGDVKQVVVKVENDHFLKEDFSVKFHGGYTEMPDNQNFELNKYGLGSYHHLACDIGYRFKKAFEGLRVDVLYVYKSTENLNSNPNPYLDFTFHQLNLIANIKF